MDSDHTSNEEPIHRAVSSVVCSDIREHEEQCNPKSLPLPDDPIDTRESLSATILTSEAALSSPPPLSSVSGKTLRDGGRITTTAAPSPVGNIT
mmetsp:Transcript_28918/g.49241  ORF Transcript_28918/g.49241 Transcript_28918/m.49241 type:complete len:94 (+) Transcript_28918:1546-1827(+)